MNKKILIPIGLLLIAGAFIFTGFSSDNSMNSSSSELENQSQEEFLGSANAGETVDATDRSEVEVSIDDFIYEETILTIKKGTKVTWVNNGDVRHNVVSHSSSGKTGLESDLLANGETYSFTFDEVGEYKYFCEPHPFRMRGVVKVVE